MATVNEIFSNYPPDIPDEQLDYLVSSVKDWTIQHGLTVRPSPANVSEETNPNHVLATNAPVTLFPSPFPKSCFEHARNLQTVYNELYATIASNEKWLKTIMKEYVPPGIRGPGHSKVSTREADHGFLVGSSKSMTSSPTCGKSIFQSNKKATLTNTRWACFDPTTC